MLLLRGILCRLVALTVTTFEAGGQWMPGADLESSDVQLIVGNVTKMGESGERARIVGDETSRLQRMEMIVGCRDRRDVRIEGDTRIRIRR